jgi:hypothetical protein
MRAIDLELGILNLVVVVVGLTGLNRVGGHGGKPRTIQLSDGFPSLATVSGASAGLVRLRLGERDLSRPADDEGALAWPKHASRPAVGVAAHVGGLSAS